MILHLLLWVSTLILLGLLGYHVYVHKISRFGRLIDRIPGRRMIPILGNAHEYSFLSTKGLWDICREVRRDFYPIFKAWGFFWPVVVLLDPDDIEILLSSRDQIDKARVYKCLHQWLATGLLTSTGEKWYRRRKMLTPSFHFAILEKFLEGFEKHSEDLVESLRSSSDEKGTVLDVLPVVSRYTLNVICETAMGVDLSAMGDFEHSYERLTHDLGQHIVFRAMKPWLYDDGVFSLTSTGRRHAKLLKGLHEFTRKIVERRKEYHRETGWVYLQPDADQSGTKKMAMLDILILNWRQGKIDDEGIREEVDTFVFEGQDTTSRALTFTILCLAQYGEFQDRCRKEVDELFDRRGQKKLRMSDLQQLPYLEQCIKESLRLYPSVPFMMRDLNDDLTLKEYVLPPKTIVVISPFYVHRDPNFWPDPETFDPERFLPERIVKRHPFSYIPFSGGHRNCIGQKFALLELKMAMSYLLRNFQLEAVDKREDVEFQIDLTLHPMKPVRVRFIPRQRKTKL